MNPLGLNNKRTNEINRTGKLIMNQTNWETGSDERHRENRTQTNEI